MVLCFSFFQLFSLWSFWSLVGLVVCSGECVSFLLSVVSVAVDMFSTTLLERWDMKRGGHGRRLLDHGGIYFPFFLLSRCVLNSEGGERAHLGTLAAARWTLFSYFFSEEGFGTIAGLFWHECCCVVTQYV
ncbi:hypothetical protein GE09DRAFT_1096744 [Coniochaeta sp. 2T2.1]|nr:hypothetical protein GE09DRAFT_1096744 [Coniochaeta sp. 2T2.1]